MKGTHGVRDGLNLRESFDVPVPTVVLAEGEFGETGGKTANGVVMHSELFETRAVVDSETAGQRPSDVLERPPPPSAVHPSREGMLLSPTK